MVENIDTLLYRFRFILVGLLMTGCLLIMGVLFSNTHAANVCLSAQGNSTPATRNGGSDSVNVVAAGMSSAVDSLSQTVDTLGRRMSCNTQSIAQTFSGGATSFSSAITNSTKSFGSALGHAGLAVLHGFGYGIRSVAVVTASLMSGGAGVVAGGLGNMAGFVSHMAIISVSTHSSAQKQIPVIDTATPIDYYAASTIPSAKTASKPSAQPLPTVAPQWPIHGMITTAFGVPEPPYEPIHTGLDISDGWRAGVTPIHPFKPGTVAQVIHGNTGLGNHVVIDHGGGITSVYGHMSSTNVQAGQIVEEGTILGYEGSTGVSTGTHLHFEIRINGVAVDPHKFIPGQPYN